MLSRRNRLGRGAFGTVATGKRAISAHFSVSFGPAEGARGAAVVSKKVAKKAVDRHLLKRRMLEALRPYLRDGRALILYARAGSPALSYKALSEEVASLLSTLPRV